MEPEGDMRPSPRTSFDLTAWPTVMTSLILAAVIVVTGCSKSGGSKLGNQSGTTVQLAGSVENGVGLDNDPSLCLGYNVGVDVEDASGTVLGVGKVGAWNWVVLSGGAEYSCQATYSVTVAKHDIYKLHVEDAGYSDMTVTSSQITNGQLPLLSGHLS